MAGKINPKQAGHGLMPGAISLKGGSGAGKRRFPGT
jgi:hypothetical protein